MRKLAVAGGVAVAGVAAETLARRLAIADAVPTTAVHAEAEWKLLRVGELRAQHRLPHTLLLGASVLDADIDPGIVEARAPQLGSVFNGCLSGSETMSMDAWWRILRRVVRPAQVAIEVHPLMVHGETSRMAASVNDALARLEDQPVPSPPARWSLPTLRRSDLAPTRIIRAARTDTRGTALRTHRNLPNGHLHRFRNTTFDEGIRTMPPDWYEVIGIDPRPNPNLQQYIDFADAVKRDVPNVMLVVSPLALDATPSTHGGHDSYLQYGDAIVRIGLELGFPVLDLRPHFTSSSDFADPFHLRSWAIRRASEMLADALADQFETTRSR